MPYTDILAKLKDAIRYVSNNIQEYVVNPGSDFSQDGKLTPERLITFLIGQGSTTQGNSVKGCYSVHLTAFLGLDSNRYTDAVVQPITLKDEFAAFRTIVDRYPLSPDTRAVFIGDRGFCSYNNMAHVIQRGQSFLFRAKDILSKGLFPLFIKYK